MDLDGPLIVLPLLPDYLQRHPLAPAPVELAIEDLLPLAEVQPAFGHSDHHLASHDLPLDVCTGIVFARVVVTVLARRLMGRDLFQPPVVVLVQPSLVVVDEYLAVMCIGFAMQSPLLR